MRGAGAQILLNPYVRAQILRRALDPERADFQSSQIQRTEAVTLIEDQIVYVWKSLCSVEKH
jgi:hypothetical protein